MLKFQYWYSIECTCYQSQIPFFFNILNLSLHFRQILRGGKSSAGGLVYRDNIIPRRKWPKSHHDIIKYLRSSFISAVTTSLTVLVIGPRLFQYFSTVGIFTCSVFRAIHNYIPSGYTGGCGEGWGRPSNPQSLKKISFIRLANPQKRPGEGNEQITFQWQTHTSRHSLSWGGRIFSYGGMIGGVWLSRAEQK